MRHTLARTDWRTPLLPALTFAAAAIVSAFAHAAEPPKISPTPSATPPSPAAAQDQQTNTDASEAGALLFNNSCRTCHAVDVGDHRLGPSLAAIVGRKAGQQSGYAYSESLKQSGITWDEKTLDAFIANPDAVVPGNNMKPYTGMTNAEDRAKIVAYLRSGATKKTE